MLEEKIWDFHSFRKNLLMISLWNILIVIFAPKIIDINLILFKLKNIDDIKIYIILFIINIYTLVRYLQYRKIRPVSKNYMFLFKEVINKWKVKQWLIPNNYDNIIEKIEIDKDRNIVVSPLPDPSGNSLPTVPYSNILQDNDYKINLIQNDINNKNLKMLILSKSNWNTTNNITNYDNIYNILFDINEVNKNFFILDKYYADIELPWIIWAISTMLIFLPIYEYILKYNIYYNMFSLIIIILACIYFSYKFFKWKQ